MHLRLRERGSAAGRASGWCSREKESTRCAKHTRRGEGRGETPVMMKQRLARRRREAGARLCLFGLCGDHRRSRRMRTKRLGAAGTRGTRCGRRLVLARTTPASRRPHPQRTMHKDRTGGDLFLFAHRTVEVSVFIYLTTPPRAATPHRDGGSALARRCPGEDAPHIGRRPGPAAAASPAAAQSAQPPPTGANVEARVTRRPCRSSAL